MANYRTAIREIEQIVDNTQELNMNNYDEMQVDEMNSSMIEICNILGNIAECESQEATDEAKAALPLQNVSKRSELLRFAKWYSTSKTAPDSIFEEIVDEYLAQ